MMSAGDGPASTPMSCIVVSRLYDPLSEDIDLAEVTHSGRCCLESYNSPPKCISGVARLAPVLTSDAQHGTMHGNNSDHAFGTGYQVRQSR